MLTMDRQITSEAEFLSETRFLRLKGLDLGFQAELG